MSLIVDASLVLAWYFEDERTAATERVLARVVEGGAVAPTHWRLEVANGFRTALRRRRIDSAYRDASIARLRRLPITIDTETHVHAWSATSVLADRFGLTPYDAAYLELAQRRGLPLASLDRELCAAARTLGIATPAATAVERGQDRPGA